MRSPRRLSISAQLPLTLACLLAIVVSALAIAGYIEVRASALALASNQLDHGASQIVDALVPSIRQTVQAIQGIADWPETRAAVAAPTPAAENALIARLRPNPNPTPNSNPNSNPSANPSARAATPGTSVEVWDLSLKRIFDLGTTLPLMAPAEASAVAESITRADGAVVAPFSLVDDAPVQVLAAPIRNNGAIAGYLVERRRLSTSPSTQLLAKVLGPDARLLLGNTSGNLWTDFTKPVSGPSTELIHTSSFFEYRRDTGVDVFGYGIPVPGSSWIVVAELPSAPILSPVRRFTTRAIGLSVLLTLIGAVIGWLLSRRVTRPLQRMTDAAEAIAAGRSSDRIALTRGDELGRLGGAFDVMTERVAAKRRQLEAVVEHYRLLFDQNPLPMWLHDLTTHRFIDVNAAAITHYGYSRDQFFGMTLRDVTDATDASIGPLGPPPSNDGMTHDTVRHHRKDGQVITVDLDWQPIVVDGERVALTVAHDVSAEIAAAEAVRASEEALRVANAELEERVRTRTVDLETANHELEAFSYSVSHDLRAPLRAIGGFGQILLDEHAAALAPDAKQCLDVIVRNTKMMGQLIDDLLTFSRLSRQPMAKISTDVGSLFRSAAGDIQRQEAAREIEFVIGDVPPAPAERSLLKHVIDNLMLNAAKFTRTRTPARIEIGATVDNGEITYYVRDNGVGFDMRYYDKLFGVFQRLHRPEDFEGTGVGLAIVYRIVSRHGGRVWADGAIDHGATFYFSLPAAADIASPHERTVA